MLWTDDAVVWNPYVQRWVLGAEGWEPIPAQIWHMDKTTARWLRAGGWGV